MTYNQLKSLKPEEFKRLCGVRPETFNQMLEVVRAQQRTKRKTGRPGKLSLEDLTVWTMHSSLPQFLPILCNAIYWLQTSFPALDEVVLNIELVKSASHYKIYQVINCLWLMIPGGYCWYNLRSSLG